jgi:hypothetical protein
MEIESLLTHCNYRAGSILRERTMVMKQKVANGGFELHIQRERALKSTNFAISHSCKAHLLLPPLLLLRFTSLHTQTLDDCDELQF